ncbi:hypothetical protein AB0K35_27625 [Micromonospora sp. NPDC053740]|uniref:hypothetical protein n=1 Tax=Micromonospora sp. NPDC053740 TaxID=3155173 RepID=UPI003427F822
MAEFLPTGSDQATRIAAKEAELARALKAFNAECDRPVGGSSRRKSFGVRLDAQIRRAAQLGGDVQRIERELSALRIQGAQRLGPAGQHDASTLAGVRFVRTDIAWYEVVKVNRATVKVKVRPGMDDLIKIGKILEARDADGATLPADAPRPVTQAKG